MAPAKRRILRCSAAALFAALPMGACEAPDAEPVAAVIAESPKEKVYLNGERFDLDVALDEQTRFTGLSGRTEIPKNGGMIFAFRFPSRQMFVMRDCPIPIDIAFLDSAGRVLTMYEMQPEEPRKPGETDYEYDQRLRKYDSRYPAQFVVETAGGRLREVGLKPGDLVKFDVQGLKARAK